MTYICVLRWFDECGVSTASEVRMRKRAREVIGENAVVVEKVAHLPCSLRMAKVGKK